MNKHAQRTMLPPNDGPPAPNLYVEFPGGTREPDGYIAPCYYTGRKSGNYLFVILWGKGRMWRHNWAQWVHIDNILLPDQVEEV